MRLYNNRDKNKDNNSFKEKEIESRGNDLIEGDKAIVIKSASGLDNFEQNSLDKEELREEKHASVPFDIEPTSYTLPDEEDNEPLDQDDDDEWFYDEDRHPPQQAPAFKPLVRYF